MRARGVGAVLGAALVLALTGCAADAPPPAGVAPVVFVHGFGEDPAVFDPLAEHLEATGYPASWLRAVELDPEGSNVAAAEGPIATAVAALLAETGQPKVDLVAHSMGAVSARWYATRIAPEQVRSLTAVVGANHGTDALCRFDSPGAREMCPAFADTDHPVQTELNGSTTAPADETPFGRGPDPAGVTSVPADGRRAIRYTAIGLPTDAWIVPAASSGLAGADLLVLPAGVAAEQPTAGTIVLTFPTDHDAVLTDEQLFTLLDAVLRQEATP